MLVAESQVLFRPCRRLALSGETTSGGAGTRAARQVMLGAWGLVDQQNNRGW
jgi:hypothetical protein